MYVDAIISRSHFFVVEGLNDSKLPGRVVRVGTDVHVPAHSTDDDLTPDNIHTRPIQFVNSSDKPTSTAPTPSHQEVIANVSRQRLDDAPHQMLHLEEAPVRGSQVIDNPGNLRPPSEAAASYGRMHSGLDQSQLFIQQPSNLLQIAAARATLAMQSHGHQHMRNIRYQMDTRRHRQKKPSPSGISDITHNQENVWEQLPQDQKTQTEAMLNRIASKVDPSMYSDLPKSSSGECYAMNDVRIPPSDANLYQQFNMKPGVNDQLSPGNDSIANGANLINHIADTPQAEAVESNDLNSEEVKSFVEITEEKNDPLNIPNSYEPDRVVVSDRDNNQSSRGDYVPAWQLAKDEVKTSKLIGSGGFGEVFEGKCRGKQVAVKLMKNRGGALQDKIVETFFSEVEIMR